MPIQIHKSEYDTTDERYVRLTTRVINEDQTGYMGHVVQERGKEASFWAGADAALEFATSTEESLKTVDFSQIYENGEVEVEDLAAFQLGVKAVFLTWQASIGLKDPEYMQSTYAHFRTTQEA